MRGVILSAGEPQGLIIGDDGRRYTFASSEWRDEDMNPGVGTRVDFTDQWPCATGLVPAPRATPALPPESETRAVEMEGTVLRIPRASGSGAIRGDDGVHYTFAFADWQSSEARPYEWGLTHSSEETHAHMPVSTPKCLLQWGLTHSSEETDAGITCYESLRVASMGPHSFERGNADLSARTAKSDGASMGPHSFERGNPSGLSYSESVHEASMGPHSFERGNALK